MGMNYAYAVTVAITVRHVDGSAWPAAAPSPTFRFPGLVAFEGPAEDDQGTCYATITAELAAELVRADEDQAEQSGDWVAGDDAYWLRMDTFQVGIRPEDITEEWAR